MWKVWGWSGWSLCFSPLFSFFLKLHRPIFGHNYGTIAANTPIPRIGATKKRSQFFIKVSINPQEPWWMRWICSFCGTMLEPASIFYDQGRDYFIAFNWLPVLELFRSLGLSQNGRSNFLRRKWGFQKTWDEWDGDVLNQVSRFPKSPRCRKHGKHVRLQWGPEFSQKSDDPMTWGYRLTCRWRVADMNFSGIWLGFWLGWTHKRS